MKLLQTCLVIFALAMPSLACSETSLDIDSPLMPGTKIVAGDASKNEFFILAANDDNPPTDIEESPVPAEIKTQTPEKTTSTQEPTKTPEAKPAVVSTKTPEAKPIELPTKSIPVTSHKKPPVIKTIQQHASNSPVDMVIKTKLLTENIKSALQKSAKDALLIQHERLQNKPIYHAVLHRTAKKLKQRLHTTFSKRNMKNEILVIRVSLYQPEKHSPASKLRKFTVLGAHKKLLRSHLASR